MVPITWFLKSNFSASPVADLKGLKTVIPITAIITTANILLNKSPSISTAIFAPIMAPIRADPDNQ